MAGKQINSGNYKFSKDFTIAGPGLDAFSGDNRSNGWCFLVNKNKRPGKDGKPESNWNSPNWKERGTSFVYKDHYPPTQDFYSYVVHPSMAKHTGKERFYNPGQGTTINKKC